MQRVRGRARGRKEKGESNVYILIKNVLLKALFHSPFLNKHFLNHYLPNKKEKENRLFPSSEAINNPQLGVEMCEPLPLHASTLTVLTLSRRPQLL